jgi:hypothetical protein
MLMLKMDRITHLVGKYSVWLFLFYISMLNMRKLDAQNALLGFKFQKSHAMYWENGLSFQYSFSKLKEGNLYFGLDIVSSRLGSAWQTNALKQSNFTLSAAWFNRNDKNLQFYSRLAVGVFKANLEFEIFEELPSSAWIVSPDFGFRYNLPKLPIYLQTGVGYNLPLQSEIETPGTFQPLYYHFSLYYKLK